ncbi:MAG: hypothetical protein MJE77_32505 [Proteobacteria bacterium]|nr:hypothetical protein [Pseudomonadota bacterium]
MSRGLVLVSLFLCFGVNELLLGGVPARAAGATAAESSRAKKGSRSARSVRASEPVSSGENLARRFARTVTGRIREGWHIRAIDVDDGQDRMVLSLTLASARAARRYSLEFSADGRRVTTYRQRAANIPRERRIYRGQTELIEFLATASPVRLDYECGSYFLGGFDDGVAVDPIAYYVVERRTSGRAAPLALASILSDSLEIGLDLVAVSAGETWPEGVVLAVEFSLAGQENRQIIAGIDGKNRVTSVEVRRVPHLDRWQVYTRGDDLLDALLRRTAIQRIAIGAGGLASDNARVILDGQLTIDMDDFVPGEFECPC